MALSNHYNPLLNVYDSNGEISEIQVDILVDLYMKNAKAGKESGGGDPFWDKSEKAFITGIIYYILENDAFAKEDKCFNTVLRKVQEAKAECDENGEPQDTQLTKEIKEWQARMERQVLLLFFHQQLKTIQFHLVFVQLLFLVLFPSTSIYGLFSFILSLLPLIFPLKHT